MNIDITNKEEIIIKQITAYVESETNKGTYYRVVKTKEEWICSCPFNSNKFKICKHIEAVREDL